MELDKHFMFTHAGDGTTAEDEFIKVVLGALEGPVLHRRRHGDDCRSRCRIGCVMPAVN